MASNWEVIDASESKVRSRLQYTLITLLALPMLLVVSGVDEGQPAERTIHALQLLYILVTGTALLALRTQRMQRLSTAAAIVVLGAVCGIEAARAFLVGGSSWFWSFSAVLALATGFALPWGIQNQFIIAMIIAGAVAIYSLLSHSFSVGAMGAIGAAVLSMFISYSRDPHR